jgi:hypothetical protein
VRVGDPAAGVASWALATDCPASAVIPNSMTTTTVKETLNRYMVILLMSVAAPDSAAARWHHRTNHRSPLSIR